MERDTSMPARMTCRPLPGQEYTNYGPMPPVRSARLGADAVRTGWTVSTARVGRPCTVAVFPGYIRPVLCVIVTDGLRRKWHQIGRG